MSDLDALSVTTADRRSVLSAWLDRRHSALLVIDMQEEFTHPESNVARWFAHQTGRDIGALPPYRPDAPMHPGDPDLDEIPRLRALIEECRGLGVPVVWVPTRIGDDTDARYWKTVGLKNCYEGEWVERISAGLSVDDRDIVVYKTRHSGFFRTDLERTLLDGGISTVLMTGRATSGCVEATSRDAMARDFGVVLVADCCGPPGPTHDADVSKIGHFFGFPASSEEVVELLRRPAGEPATSRH